MTIAPAKFVFDSSAWIEYFRATKAGKQIDKLLEDPSNVILTPHIVCGEVVSMVARLGKPTEEAMAAIQNKSISPLEDRQTYFTAGHLHAQLRQKIKNISLADAIVLALAEKNNAAIVTLDSHLKGKNTILLEQ